MSSREASVEVFKKVPFLVWLIKQKFLPPMRQSLTVRTLSIEEFYNHNIKAFRKNKEMVETNSSSNFSAELKPVVLCGDFFSASTEPLEAG